jgi:squalene-associated FAD-dependent desaturase
MGNVHIIGAGLAGLSAAIRLRERGWDVTVYEAAGQAGGRARSYFDDQLGCRIDNGNHLLLSGNRSAMRYIETIGATKGLICAPEAAIPFVDLQSGERWTVRINRGLIPWWIFRRSQRVAGTRARDYLGGGRLAFAGRKTISQMFGRNEPLFSRFWDPLTVAALNTASTEAAARLLWPVMKETLGRGGARSRPCVVREGLSEGLVDPALQWLGDRGAEIRFNARVRSLLRPEAGTGREIDGFQIGDEVIDLTDADRLVLAVTPSVVRALVPEISTPVETRPIVNAHYKLEAPLILPDGLPLLGLIGGVAQWLFTRGNIISVTISAAEAEVDLPAEELEQRIWQDICRALDLGDTPLPPCRIVKEKRATFAQTPDQVAKRPGAQTPISNLYLAGDWTDTGLPATIESAVRSGEIAARAIGSPTG